MWTNGLRLWGDMMKAGAAAADAGVKLAETMAASADVVQSRSRTIAEACRDPIGGDHRELARMMPEKVEAFGAAGRIAFAEFSALQSAAFADWQRMAVLAMSGRAPSADELAGMASRSSRLTERASKAAGKALAPIHRSATGNARRLKRKAG